MATAFAGPIRVPGINNHEDRCHDVWAGEDKAVLQICKSSTFQFETAGKEGHAAIGRAVVQEVNRHHHIDISLPAAGPEGDFLGLLEFGLLLLESLLDKFPFLGRNPFCLAWMIADEKPPDWQPDERQSALEHQCVFPAVSSEEGSRDRG